MTKISGKHDADRYKARRSIVKDPMLVGLTEIGVIASDTHLFHLESPAYCSLLGNGHIFSSRPISGYEL